MNKEIFEKLKELEIEYKKIEHPAAFTMEEIEEYHLTENGHIPKNLVLRDVRVLAICLLYFTVTNEQIYS